MSTPTIRVIDFHTVLRRGKPVDMVTWAPAGGAMYTQVVERVKDLIPPADFDDGDERVGQKISRIRAKWAMIEPAYMAWKNGKEMPEHGTPLAAWAGVTAEQIKVLQLAGIRSVEDLAGAQDNVMERVKLPGKNDLKKQAEIFLETADKSEAAERLAAAQDEIAMLKEQMSELIEAVKQDKPKRGRPAKTENSDSEAA